MTETFLFFAAARTFRIPCRSMHRIPQLSGTFSCAVCRYLPPTTRVFSSKNCSYAATWRPIRSKLSLSLLISNPHNLSVTSIKSQMDEPIFFS